MAKTSQIIKSQRSSKFKDRHVNRCHLCGRPRSYIRYFGICRICFRRLAHQGELPGVVKASN